LFLSRMFGDIEPSDEPMQEVELTPDFLSQLDLAQLPDFNIETLSSLDREGWEAIWTAIERVSLNVYNKSLSVPHVKRQSITYWVGA